MGGGHHFHYPKWVWSPSGYVNAFLFVVIAVCVIIILSSFCYHHHHHNIIIIVVGGQILQHGKEIQHYTLGLW
jgi:hypothetical protein